jgi:hypothetical protein
MGEAAIILKASSGVRVKRFDLGAFMRSSRPLQYVQGKLEEMDNGSSRRVYALGDDLVIKVAYAGYEIRGKVLPVQAGYAQNEVEVRVSADPKSRGVVARVVAAHPRYHWVISERAYPQDDGEPWPDNFKSEVWDHLCKKHPLLVDDDEIMILRGQEVMVDYGLSTEVYRRYYC